MALVGTGSSKWQLSYVFPPLPSSWVMSGEVATCAVMHTYTSKISESSESIIYPLFGMQQQQQPPRLTWTRTHQYVVWCCPDESDAGSCICHGPPSHSRRGSGHWGSFYSRRQLLPARCSGTEREQRWQMNNNKKKTSPMRLFRSLTPSAPCDPPSADTPLSAVIKSIFVRSCMQYHGLFWWWDREQFCLSRTTVGWAASDFCALIKTNKMMIMRPQQY